MKVYGASVRRTRIGRAISVGMIVVTLAVGGFAWHLGFCGLVAFNAFLLGINVILAWINWFVFET